MWILFLVSLLDFFAVLKGDILSETPLMGQFKQVLRMKADERRSLIDSSLPDIHVFEDHFVLNHNL